jgi:uncharacterized protein (TIGR00288 family)
MDRPIRAALLIDADNVNLEVVAEVLRRLDDGRRRLVHRRAYGSLQKANEFEPLVQKHAIRFFTTTYAGTNGTDVALAIDAIELALSHPIDEVALVTSDCDFLPLVARLRELGCRVCGFGQRGKSARDIERDYLCVYDEFSVIDGAAKPGARAGAKAEPARPGGRAAATAASADGPRAAKRPARGSRASAVPAEPVAAPASAAAAAEAPAAAVPRAPAPRRAASSRTRAPARSALPAEAPPPAHAATPVRAPTPSRAPMHAPAVPAADTSSRVDLDERVPRSAASGGRGGAPVTPHTADDELLRRILDAVPALGAGDAVELGGAAQQLRAAQLLAKTAPSTKLFRKYPEHFELTPARQPNKVRYRAA